MNSGHQGDFWIDYNVMQVMLDVNERLVGMKIIVNGVSKIVPNNICLLILDFDIFVLRSFFL